MEAEDEVQEDAYQEEEDYPDESTVTVPQALTVEQPEEFFITDEEKRAMQKPEEKGLLHNLASNNMTEDRSSFVHGLSVGLGVGCVSTFVIMWITVFFSPQLPSTITYEAMLSVFVYPLIYLLAVGLIALTAGIVREYYAKRSMF
ncbi:hypothetical protein GTO27_10390 [Candidatus Bathyarchaeota archaeon]|nr:hypothetical protein [Candidatus Bathyarchaeota archaeon]